MAQPGNFTPILLYGSSTPTNVPLAANLTNSATGSEIAINVADKNLFFKDSGGVVNTVPIRQSSTSSNGWLSATDWNTFNGKAPATSGTSILYGNGTGGFSNVTIGSGISFAGGTLSATGTGGTVTSVAALTLGTTGTDLSSTVANGTTTPVITLNVPTASATNRGALSAADWSTFNGKQAALVSGTNIKTVGGVTLLGSGDVGTIGVGYGGTGTSTAFTAGSVLFAGASGVYSQDNANFFWDDTNNRLGLGTATPPWMLTLNLSSGGGSTGTYPALAINNPNANGYAAMYFYNGATLISGLETNTLSQNLSFYAGTTTKAILNASGNFLVGTSTALQSTSTFYNASNPACVFYRPISSGGASIASFFSDVGGAATFKSYVDSAGAFTTVSDVRTKKNVEPISTGLSVVAKLRPVSFNWKYEDDALPKTNGFIAQEVELVYPEAVTTMDVSKSNGYVDQKMMKNDALLPILVKALQELNEKFDAYVASHP